MKVQILAFAALVLVASSSFAQQTCVLKRGTEFKDYTSGREMELVKSKAGAITQSTLVLPHANAALAALVVHGARSDMYNGVSTLAESIQLTVEKQDVVRGEGSTCDYRGISGNDPDFACKSANSGAWATTLLTLHDNLGNEWTYWTKTAFIVSSRDLGPDAELISKLSASLALECSLR